MNIILIFFLVLPESSSLSNVFYGNYNNAVYNPLRNEYFWEHGTNIIPVHTNDAEMISFSWVIRDKNIYDETYNQFIRKQYKKDEVCFQWIPLEDKRDVCALIQGNVDEKERKIKIHTIFLKPYVETKQMEYLMSDINQIKLLQEFNDYSIEVRTNLAT